MDNLQKPAPLLHRTIDDVLEKPLISALRNEPSALVLSGVSDTKVYVNCEWLLDKFNQRYPAIPMKKKPFSEVEWPEFRASLTAPTGWPDNGEVIVYREALGHPLLFIGGLDRFRLYLNQLYQFSCALIPESAIAGYILDNRAELLKADEARRRPPDPEDVWRVAVISTNHLEIIPLYLLHAFGTCSVLGEGKQVELVIHNTTATSGRFNFTWRQGAVDDYMETNRWRFPLLKSASYEPDLNAALRRNDLVILLWSLRQKLYDAIEGRVYTVREGMDEELRAILCQEIFREFHPITTALSAAVDLEKTKFLLTSSRFKTPLSAVGTYLLQKIASIGPRNILVDCVAIDRSYRSVIAEELGVRTVDVVNTTVWGDIGGTMLMDPTAARVRGHKGVIEAPISVLFSRPLLDIYWDAHKLQVEFAVDALRRANYLELLEGARCSSILVAESTISLLQLWRGTYPPPTDLEAGLCPRSVGVVTTKETGPAVVPGLVLAMPVSFQANGTLDVVNGNTREEIRTILKKASTEVTEMLATMKQHVDPSLVATARSNVPEISVLPEVDSGLHVTAFRLASPTHASQEFVFNISGSEIVP